MADSDAKTKDWTGASDRRKGTSPGGSLVFTLLRLCDIPWQYNLLNGIGTSLIRYLGGTAIVASSAPAAGLLGLSPYHTLLVALSASAAARHVYWKLSIADYVFPASIAVVVSSYNTILNTANSLLALWTVTSQDPFSPSFSHLFTSGLLERPAISIGLTLFAVGIAVETISEFQRKQFKSKPENKDKPFADGLFSLATNINYTGYLLWRIGYALVCGGFAWGLLTAVWQGCDFAFRAVPGMDDYCQKRYGQQWTEVRRKVPSRLLPGLY